MTENPKPGLLADTDVEQTAPAQASLWRSLATAQTFREVTPEEWMNELRLGALAITRRNARRIEQTTAS
jgi:hypothetical protein